MARKPIHLEMKGGKNPRQRVWEAIRRQRDGFLQRDIVFASQTDTGIVQDYIKALCKGGYIEIAGEENLGGAAVRRSYRLIRDNGVDAPRLSRQGVEVAQGLVNEAMWSTMRRMFVATDFNYLELAAFAGSPARPISDVTAASYVSKLSIAGYLECVTPETRNKGKSALARYRLRKSMESGPKVPLIQRTKVVFDPNWNRVVWLEHEGVTDE